MSDETDESVFAGVAARLGGRLRGHAPLTGGVSARVESIEIELAGSEVRRMVFRQPGAAQWKAQSEDTTRREHDLLAWLHARGVPVPRPLLLDLSCEVVSRPYFMMEYVEGTQETTDPPAALRRMAELLAAVHRLPLEHAPPLPAREDPIAGLLGLLPPEHDALRARLLHAPPELASRRTMLHGDYWPGNLLWRERKLVALLDWEDAARGDPLSDLACGCLELRYKHGAEAAEVFAQHYATNARCDLRELPVWDAYVAAAALASMGRWGLEPSLESHMRDEASAALRGAAERLLGSAAR